jgi:hypothetical protein
MTAKNTPATSHDTKTVIATLTIGNQTINLNLPEVMPEYLEEMGNLAESENFLNLLSRNIGGIIANYQKPIYIRDIVGKMYSTESVRKYLGGITQEELEALIEDNLILHVKDKKGNIGYPLFQFKDGTINPKVQKIIKILLKQYPTDYGLKGGRSEWETAIWLANPCEMYNNKSAVEYMEDSPEAYRHVIMDAKADANDRYANSWGNNT